MAGFTVLAESGEGFPVPEHDSQAANQGGSRNDGACQERFEFGSRCSCFRCLWLIWHWMSGGGSFRGRQQPLLEILNCVGDLYIGGFGVTLFWRLGITSGLESSSEINRSRRLYKASEFRD